MTAPGWYHGESDPPGTVRYWDGQQWVGDAVAPSAAAAPGVPAAPGSAGSQKDYSACWLRMAGRVIDFIIGSVLFIAFIISGIGGDDPSYVDGRNGYSLNFNDNRLDTGLEFIVLGVFLLLYHALTTHFLGGTPGKLAVGLRVADAETGTTPVSLQQAAIRSVNYLHFALIGIVISLETALAAISLFAGLVSLILLFADGKHRTVMDFLAKTIVVKN